MKVIDYKKGITRSDEIPLRGGICEHCARACKLLLRCMLLWDRARERKEKSQSPFKDHVSQFTALLRTRTSCPTEQATARIGELTTAVK